MTVEAMDLLQWSSPNQATMRERDVAIIQEVAGEDGDAADTVNHEYRPFRRLSNR